MYITSNIKNIAVSLSALTSAWCQLLSKDENKELELAQAIWYIYIASDYSLLDGWIIP